MALRRASAADSEVRTTGVSPLRRFAPPVEMTLWGNGGPERSGWVQRLAGRRGSSDGGKYRGLSTAAPYASGRDDGVGGRFGRRRLWDAARSKSRAGRSVVVSGRAGIRVASELSTGAKYRGLSTAALCAFGRDDGAMKRSGVGGVVWRNGFAPIFAEILPGWVLIHDQAELFDARPAFDLLFPGYGGGHRGVPLEVNQVLYVVALREAAGEGSGGVLEHALLEVGGYADVEMFEAGGQDVHVGCLGHGEMLPGPMVARHTTFRAAW